MTRTQGRVIAGILAIATFVISQFIKDASLFGLSAQAAELLVILNGVLALTVNYLPNIFRAEPAPLP